MAQSDPGSLYAELHLHSAFSFLDGASLPGELVGRARALGYRYLALTDHDGLHGAMEFAQVAREAEIAPITGAELTLRDESHLTLLVESTTGYANLCRLITGAHAIDPANPWPKTPDQRTPRLDPALLAQHAEGLVLLTGCPKGQLSQAVDANDLPAARALLRQYIEWFGPESVYVELQHNMVYGDTPRVTKLSRLAQELRLPTVATGNVHYHAPRRHRLQDVLVAIRHRTTLDGSHQQRRANRDFALRPPHEAAKRFAAYPTAVRNSVLLAERCASFDLTHGLPYQFPTAEAREGAADADEALRQLCLDVFAARYPPGHAHRQAAALRVREELALIRQQGLAHFFLLHAELLNLAEEVAREVRAEQGRPAASPLPPGRGRGSSVSSVVCYLIGLSPVDPVAHNLSLGRFLNDARTEPPDIDLDFPREIRARLIERVYEHYPERAGLLCAFPTYHLRSAVRDVGKALGIPASDLDRISKLAEPGSAAKLAEELARLPGYAPRLEEPPWCFLIELAADLAGFPRHVSQHSGGMVIAARPMTELVPLQPAAMEGRWILQWDKDSAADAGFVKLDLLALGMLEAVEECVQLIAAHHPADPPPDLTRIDLADRRVYNMICAGDTLGTFQVESRAQIQTLIKTQPRSIEDLTVQVAIVRPGPIVGGATSPYIQRRLDPHFQPHYDHPLLEPVLRDTMGVILYQDQVIEVAMAVAGFSAGQADQLRRAMTRKRSREAMVALWQQFRDGCAGNGVGEATAETIFDKLLGFAAYGFPKGHAASFAVLAYQSSWLKHYYPTEFLCALVNNQPMGFYSVGVLANEAKRRGVRTLHPTINTSGVRSNVAGQRAIRLGLAQVKGVGEDVARAILAEREANGPYRCISDLAQRVPLALGVLEALALVGTFDEFGLGRREALWQAGLLIPAKRFGPRRERSNKDRGHQLALPVPIKQDMVTPEPMSAWDRAREEYRGLGLSPLWHPLGLLRSGLPPKWVTTTDLNALPHGAAVTLAGLAVCRQRPETAKGITFLLLEDEGGLVNVIVSPRIYEERRHVVRSVPYLVVEGRLERQHGTINVVARTVGAMPVPESFLPPAEEGQTQEAVASAELPAPPAHNYR